MIQWAVEALCDDPYELFVGDKVSGSIEATFMYSRISFVCLLAPGALLAEPCSDTCMRLGFDDYPQEGFYEYVVSRTTYVEMMEASENTREGPPISESEAVSLALRATSSSPDQVRGVHYAKTVKSPGEVWIYLVDIRSSDYEGLVVIGPTGEVVERTFVEGAMTAHPDCSRYRFKN